MIYSYPKIYNLGHPATKDIFDYIERVEEKIDGSQFSFGKDTDGNIQFRTRGGPIYPETAQKLFKDAVENVLKRKDLLMPGVIYRGEVLHKPKHNTIAYSRIPKDNIILFDVCTENESYATREHLEEQAKRIDFEVVPIVTGIQTYSNYQKFLEVCLYRESILGGAKIEGVVIKTRNLFGKDSKPIFAKYVSSEFKEKHNKDWKGSNPTKKDLIQTIGDELRTEARWLKSIQRLRDEGKLVNDPKDIGLLLKEIQQDIVAEEDTYIKEMLYKYAKPKILRIATAGFPEFYKKYLFKETFGDAKN